MNRQLLITALITGAFTLPLCANAQLSLPKLSVPGSSNSGSGNLNASQDQLVTQYTGANRDVLAGDGQIAQAIGLKDQAAKLNALATAANTGASEDTLKSNDSAVSESTRAISEALKANPAMDATAKKQYSQGLTSLAKGVTEYVGLKQPAADFSKGLSSSPAMMQKMQAGAYVVKTLPGNVSTLGRSLSEAVNFAKAHDIAVPEDATSALSKLP